MTEKYIGVNAFISTLKEMQKGFGNWSRSFGKTATYVLEETINKLQSFPAADVEPIRHGHWIKGQDGDKIFCSACNSYLVGSFESVKKTFKFCFNCGARMDEEMKEDAEIC